MQSHWQTMSRTQRLCASSRKHQVHGPPSGDPSGGLVSAACPHLDVQVLFFFGNTLFDIIWVKLTTWRPVRVCMRNFLETNCQWPEHYTSSFYLTVFSFCRVLLRCCPYSPWIHLEVMFHHLFATRACHPRNHDSSRGCPISPIHVPSMSPCPCALRGRSAAALQASLVGGASTALAWPSWKIRLSEQQNGFPLWWWFRGAYIYVYYIKYIYIYNIENLIYIYIYR